ncbi:helix-turn-helix domain-containing protein [Salmonella enterica subsp. enterica]|uniref:Helix-turn-helix domain-containing protein n=1 Tax=Salmonella enterica subsp. enterica serovar Kisarawe TaxID=2517242 RepID=A0A5X8YZF5_SALET|nr:helix-turn-helix domain-containing protein [Salmonella enterica]EBY9400020.1 helix-turn-helix domain-containing protein [Salmonella enterica subsp. enterica serovar Kisarawe]ECD5791510.1 helix-turn-helix domain-containing protein [Salmonella enterica subsp. enterica serovar Monschaui]EDS6474031.1 helix-turn-helix domain-containing protein [Salmonella enterica subsp. enterica]EHN2042168.1 helix-turn-helix domain-containing protein [Salmonella enterica subsp. enterica serovar Nima]
MLANRFYLDTNMNFEERLLRALEEAGISQSELGRRVGVNSQTVSNWCNTGNFPRKEKLELFPQALGKPLYWFFMTDEEENQLKAITASKTVLTEKQAALLDVFDQLPEVEQTRFVQLASDRLEELDKFMAEFLSKRKIEPPPPKD